MWYNQQALDELKRNFDRESLEHRINSALYDLEQINAYLEAVKEQLARVEQTEFIKEVYFERKKYDRVYYYVGMRVIPNIENGRNMQYPVIGAKRFTGKEKKQAREYAQKLAQEHGAKIVETG